MPAIATLAVMPLVVIRRREMPGEVGSAEGRRMMSGSEVVTIGDHMRLGNPPWPAKNALSRQVVSPR
ncbi:hypothetical protein GCM10009837_44160 [Streptomyces durmitorensis]